MDDVGAIAISAGAFGVLSVAALITVLVARVRDYAPSIGGRSAMATVDVISLVVAALVLYQAGARFDVIDDWIALLLGTLTFGIIARGIWAQQKGGS